MTSDPQEICMKHKIRLLVSFLGFDLLENNQKRIIYVILQSSLALWVLRNNHVFFFVFVQIFKQLRFSVKFLTNSESHNLPLNS